VTRDGAIAEAQHRQATDPDAKWIATQRDGEWIVARIGLRPASARPLGETVQPQPSAPHNPPQSDLQRVVTQFGSVG
jgi:hypothetical protein